MAVTVPIPVIAELPPAPRRNDGPPDFVLKADAMIAALHPLVQQINIALQWISGQLTDTQASEQAAAVSAKAAADSVTEAVRQVELATEQAVLAGRERKGAEAALDSTEVVAAAVQSGAGFPALAGHAAHALRVKLDESGVEFSELGQEIGDVLITRRATTPPGYVLPGTLYAQAAYPELFTLTGILEVNNDGANLAANGNPLPGARLALCGKDDVIVIISGTAAKRSVDYGVTWVTIPTLVGGSLYSAVTDGNGVWLCTDNNPPALRRSVDNGVTWTALPSFDSSSTPVAFAAGEAGEFVALSVVNTTRTFWRSTDYGVTWVKGHTSGTAFDNTVGMDSKGRWVAPVQNSTAPAHSDDGFFTAFLAGGPTRMVNNPANGLLAGIASYVNGGVMVSDDVIGKGWEVNYSVPGNYLVVDKVGVVHSSQYELTTGQSTAIYRSYDKGKTWAKFPRLTLPSGALGSASVACTSTGVWVSVNGGSAIYRATRLYNYDAATQFKTPHAKAPSGMYAYIKAKKV